MVDHHFEDYYHDNLQPTLIAIRVMHVKQNGNVIIALRKGNLGYNYNEMHHWHGYNYEGRWHVK